MTGRIETVLGHRWARIGLALAAGAGAALAHTPFGFLPGMLGYPLLMLLAERSATVRGAAWMGWLAGFAYFLIGCWWVAEAFLVNPAQAWMAPFAASLLPMGLGLFWAAAMALYRRFARPDAWRVLVFAALFGLLEWLRGHVLTGFPWNPAGAGWKAGSAASQFAAVAGVYGLSLVTVAAFAAFGPLAVAGPRRGRIVAAGLGALALAGLVLGGTVRLAQARVQPTAVTVRIVQADIAQDYKWSADAYGSIVDRYLNLTTQPAAVRPDVVVWPEGALPATAADVFGPGSPEADALARALQPGQTLIMGLSRGQADPSAEGGARYFNSLFVLHDEGAAGLRIAAVYDKYRLVPFGEYLPLGAVMSALGVRSLVHVPADFSAGPRPAPIQIPGAGRAQPLICYEGLYPGFTPGAGGRPGWIVNISNDAWFGATSGPVQHLNLAAYRAIETGLPIVRSTPTGVSALIDSWGRVGAHDRLNAGESGVIDVRLPHPTAVTPYGRFGDLPVLFMILAGLSPAFLGGRRRVLPQ
ncbi:MAG: apolipoprotein N-acyltransferase [Brevundimonas sp.]|uniref:apolipoprotein N-acyltransferase n=1 Tax=Brevundimonas sp. TaxID=1871086 RepID=UPI0025BE2151|nr:apolipoprotein N-acyltransferase [Brevundimonas sp.]MBX3478157.1 apolipoprotein N-acyltransferase [Brevundimonas sp.]